MTDEALMSRVKSCLHFFDWDRPANQAIFAEVKAINSEIRLEHNKDKRAIEKTFKAQKAEEAKALPSKRMTDEELADAIDVMICTKVVDGTISAAEIAQLKDIRNIKLKDRDVVINVVNYKDLA